MKKNENIILKAVKKKRALVIAGVGGPLLFFIFLFCFLMIPVFTIGANIYDHYSGAENAGGLRMKFSREGIFAPPILADSVLITSGFGMRLHPIDNTYKNHDGIDIACSQGTEVYAVNDGTVTFAGASEGYGNLVIIKLYHGYEAYYGHLSDIKVTPGTLVTKGQTIIGLSGGTPGTPGAGDSTGPHLHFEVHKDGVPVDPADLLGLIQDGGAVIPKDLEYDEYDEDDKRRVLQYLVDKNSLLAQEPYFSTIMSTGKRYGVNSLLLFAITGQEQSFVPVNDRDALTIANNPFNVYVSWQEYNTDIADSAAIAAGTIINLSKGRPDNADPIQWINTRGGTGGYAGDSNWYIGVSKFFTELKGLIKDND